MLILESGIAVLEPSRDRVLSRLVEQLGSLDAYDYRIRSLIAPLIPNGGCVVDGGAFLGSHTVVYAEAVGVGGSVMAFEPALRHAECLCYNVRSLPQVEVVQAALYSEEATLWLAPNWTNAGATVVGSPDDLGAFEVQAFPLDAFDWPRLDFLKLDIEGLVLRALQGARRVLRECRPTVLVEVGENLGLFGDTAGDLLNFMDAQHYRAEVLPTPDGGESEQRDVLFVPKEKQ